MNEKGIEWVDLSFTSWYQNRGLSDGRPNSKVVQENMDVKDAGEIKSSFKFQLLTITIIIPFQLEWMVIVLWYKKFIVDDFAGKWTRKRSYDKDANLIIRGFLIDGHI